MENDLQITAERLLATELLTSPLMRVTFAQPLQPEQPPRIIPCPGL
jgi:hypothetical protein